MKNKIVSVVSPYISTEDVKKSLGLLYMGKRPLTKEEMEALCKSDIGLKYNGLRKGINKDLRSKI